PAGIGAARSASVARVTNALRRSRWAVFWATYERSTGIRHLLGNVIVETWCAPRTPDCERCEKLVDASHGEDAPHPFGDQLRIAQQAGAVHQHELLAQMDDRARALEPAHHAQLT